jgi:hypothetical protein
MFFQDVPPDTSAYMTAGYTIFFSLFGIYLFSLFIRSRNLRQDLDVLEAMQKESKVPAAPKRRAVNQAAGRSKPAGRKKS